MWKAHWSLLRNPFAAAGSPYVSLPSHDEAVARLVHAIETGDRAATLIAGAGLGKTSVLRQALGEARHPRRRLTLLSCPRDEILLVAALAERLGERVGREPTRLAAWRALERAISLASIEGAQVVIGIDDCERADAGLRRGIEAIRGLAPGSDARITVIQAGRPLRARRRDLEGQGTHTLTLESLTRTQTEIYLVRKLTEAGCDGAAFTARAITRLHCVCAGVPAQIERVATLCLMAGAARGLEVIPPELVDAAHESQNGHCSLEPQCNESVRRLSSTQAG